MTESLVDHAEVMEAYRELSRIAGGEAQRAAELAMLCFMVICLTHNNDCTTREMILQYATELVMTTTFEVTNEQGLPEWAAN